MFIANKERKFATKRFITIVQFLTSWLKAFYNKSSNIMNNDIVFDESKLDFLRIKALKMVAKLQLHVDQIRSQEALVVLRLALGLSLSWVLPQWAKNYLERIWLMRIIEPNTWQRLLWLDLRIWIAMYTLQFNFGKNLLIQAYWVCASLANNLNCC